MPRTFGAIVEDGAREQRAAYRLARSVRRRSGTARPELGELLGHALPRGTAPGVAGRQRTLGVSTERTSGSARRDRGQVGVREVPQLDPTLLALLDARAGDLVGDPERHLLRTSHSAMSVARENPCGASSSIRAVLNAAWRSSR